MELTNFNTPQEWLTMFEDAKKVRPCSFNPTPYLKTSDATETRGPNVFLPLEAKRTWFYTYCHETGAKGKILVSDPSITFDLSNNSNYRFGFVSSKCDIILDGEIVGNATAGLAFSIDNFGEMSNAIQNVTGTAQSRALSNAGFGAVSGTDMEVSGNQQENEYSDKDLPFTLPATPPAPTCTNVHTASSGSAVSPTLSKSEPNKSLQQTFQDLSGQTTLSPVEMAKATVISFNCKDTGKTMGDILTGIGGTKNIYYYAFEWTRTGAEFEPIRNAAKLIWFDLDSAVRKQVLKSKPGAPDDAKVGL